MERLLSFVRVLIGVALVIVAVGCGGGGSGGGGTSTIKPKIRAFNASPDSNPLLVTLNTDPLVTAQPYLDSTSVFVEKKALTYDVEVFDAITDDSLDAITAQLENNKKYALISYGIENFNTEFFKRLQTVLVPVDLTAPTGNKANLIVFHAFNRAAGFDTPAIDFQNPGDNPQYAITNIGYGSSNSIVVDSGNTLTFQARRNATEEIYASSTPNLDAGGVYLVLVSGIEGQTGTEQPQITYLKMN